MYVSVEGLGEVHKTEIRRAIEYRLSPHATCGHFCLPLFFSVFVGYHSIFLLSILCAHISVFLLILLLSSSAPPSCCVVATSLTLIRLQKYAAGSGGTCGPGKRGFHSGGFGVPFFVCHIGEALRNFLTSVYSHVSGRPRALITFIFLCNKIQEYIRSDGYPLRTRGVKPDLSRI